MSYVAGISRAQIMLFPEEGAIDRMRERIKQHPEVMKKRKQKYFL
jgi:hypothetical protein